MYFLKRTFCRISDVEKCLYNIIGVKCLVGSTLTCKSFELVLGHSHFLYDQSGVT